MLQYDFDCLCSDVIAHNASLFRRSVAVVCDDRRLTWEELNEHTNRFANALLGMGLTKGDKVCVFMSNSIETFVAFWGVIKAGCVVVPVNTLLERQSFIRTVNASDSVALFTDAGMRPLVDLARGELTSIPADRFFGFGFKADGWREAQPLIDTAASTKPEVKISLLDSMTIIYSSGSTGVPKGIEHAHYGRINYSLGFAIALSVDRYSVAVCSTPIFATGTWQTMFPAMCQGGTVVLLRKFSAEAVLDAVQREKGSHLFMVPAQYIALLQADVGRYDTSSLKMLLTAGQSLPQVTYDTLRETFPGVRIIEAYGASEGFSTICLPEDVERGKRGSVGKPSFFDDIRVIDPDSGQQLEDGKTGEIVAYGPAMMKGYYNRPELTKAATWVSPAGRNYIRSGDLGYLDEDGFLYCVGRLKDMIKSGGINIFAIDVEQVVTQHPEVLEASVIGVPHPKWVETPLAVVVLRNKGAISSEALMAWVNERLAKYQRVSAVVLHDEMPRVTYGKVQKQALRDRYAAYWS